MLYKLPKDILIELILKSYGNFNHLSIEDIYKIKNVCDNKIGKEKRNDRDALRKIYNIDNIKIFCDHNDKIIVEDTLRNMPINNYGKHEITQKVISVEVFHRGRHAFPFGLYRYDAGKEFYNGHLRNSEDLLHALKIALVPYEDKMGEILKILKLLLEIRLTEYHEDKITKIPVNF